jgi:SAM-dependent methyltransferase
MNYRENPEVSEDWVTRSIQFFNSFGSVVWPEQQKIYHNLKDRIKGKKVLEAGCGIGYGTALLHLENEVVGTDKNSRQVGYAKAIYPFCKFDVWDVSIRTYQEHDIVVAIEVLEHIKDYQAAMKNLIDSAKDTIYLSTPNRNHPDIGNDNPHNKLHVKEFTPREIIKMSGEKVEVLDWSTFEKLDEETTVTPLVYKICKNQSL